MTNTEPHFYQFLAEGNILCNIDSQTKNEAISELAQRLAMNTAGVDAPSATEAVLAREAVVPTVIAPGLAVPHARLEGVTNLLVALGTSTKGIDFGAPGMGPVNIIILVLTPKDDPALHLQVMAALAKDFNKPDVPRKLAAMESPADILEYFSDQHVEIPDYISAMDVMGKAQTTLREDDTLNHAIELFATQRVLDIPVIDEEGDLRGIVSLEDILKFSLPEHILWMDDLTPIRNFQPFAEMLRADNDTKIADVMREDVLSVEESIPAIQLAKIFTVKGLRQILVTRDTQLVGVVNLSSFITKLFWA